MSSVAAEDRRRERDALARRVLANPASRPVTALLPGDAARYDGHMSTPARAGPSWWTIPVVAAVLTLPVAAALDRPLVGAAGAILCRAPHGTLVVRVSRNLSRDPRYVGSAGATSLCVDPTTETDCRWGRPSCRAVPVATAATYATLLGLAFALSLLPGAAVIALVRRRRSRRKP
jgi:hypothetical protein